MGTYVTIGEIIDRVPKDNLSRIDVPYDRSYVPTYGEISSIFPKYRDGGDKPMLSLDGIKVDGEYSDDDFLPSGSVDWVSMCIEGLNCYVIGLHGEVPISGGTYGISATVKFTRKVNGVDDVDTFKDVKPYIKVIGREDVEVYGDSVVIPANLSTKKTHTDIECQYGYKGTLLKKRLCIEQSENGFNEWERSDDESETLELSVENPSFGMDGGITRYNVYRKYVETMVKRDWIGNIVEKKQVGERTDDVTSESSIYNPYDRKFIIGDGEIICARQKPNGRPLACTIIARHKDLEAKCRLTQDAGIPTTTETVLEFKENHGKKISKTVVNGETNISVGIRSVEIEKINGEVVEERNNTMLSAHSKERWVDAYIGIDENEGITLDVDITSPNESKTKERKAMVLVSRRRGDAEPILLEITQSPALVDEKEYQINCSYHRTVYMDICDGDRVNIKCYEVKRFDDGTKVRTSVDDEKVELKLSIENDGGMVTISEPVNIGTGEYESILGFTSSNMNDFTDFRFSLYSKEDGELLHSGRLESIKCVETPIKVIEKKPVPETNINLIEKNKLPKDIRTTPRFVINRGKDGRMRFVSK